MTRPLPRRIAACLAAALVTTLVALSAPGSAPAADADESGGESGGDPGASQTPLRVSIDELSPSSIPPKGRIIVSGHITNVSDSSWTDLQVYLLTSAQPIRSNEELQKAATTDPATYIGSRITRDGLYDEIGDLGPGASTPYTLSIARKNLQISGAAGVYWLGVHVLGANEDGRDGAADGRARSFLPLMRPNGPSTSMALVVPIRGEVRRHADGTLAYLGHWQRTFGMDGRLGRLLGLGASSSAPVTWLVDPAVIDAAHSVAADNPPMSLAPADRRTKPETTPSASPTGPPTPFPSEGTSDSSPPAKLSPAARDALTWLSLFSRVSSQGTVLTVPYGDLDVSSVLHGDRVDSYHRALALGTQTMRALDIESTAVVAPASGVLPTDVLDEIDPSTPVLLSDRAAPEAVGSVVRQPDLPTIVLSDSSASSGGPSPTPRYASLAFRQRILAEAALHALSPDRLSPLVVTTPSLWNPGERANGTAFFDSLDTSWLRLTGLPSASTARSSVRDDADTDPAPVDLVYSGAQRRTELPAANLVATHDLTVTGQVLAGLLTRNDTVDDFVTKSALLASSAYARQNPAIARARARAAGAAIRTTMTGVEIDAPPFVTMSSEKGTFQVTLVNNLEEPVSVGLEVRTGSKDLVIDAPGKLNLAPGARASLRLRAQAADIGVHSVTLWPTNGDGAVLGYNTRFSVRSSQVGLVIWGIMGIGAGVLFLAIAIRLVRRIRGRAAPAEQHE